MDSPPLTTSSSDENLLLSESLIPSQLHKTPTTTTTSFDGLLSQPLHLKEDLKEGCGGQLWPAGVVLAKYMLRQHRSDLGQKTILELGAGGGLVGLAVAKGCDTSNPLYITDRFPMLPLMLSNIELNGLISQVNAMVLEWGEVIPPEIPQPVGVVLAADCVYFEPAFPLLLATLGELIGEETVCYFCFKKRRRADMRFMKVARKMFEVGEVGDDCDREVYSKEQIFLYTLRRRRN